MRRKIDAYLDSWKGSASRKPLLLFGARQTGKTTSVLAFAERAFSNVIYVDFIKRPDLAAAFEGSLDPDEIIVALAAMLKVKAEPSKTLLFLDEIQQCDAAITSLKYFCADAPEWCVVAAGSLLGVHVAREGYSFPVGYVDMKTMHPMDFEEYCWATDNEGLFSLARKSYQTMTKCVAHESLMEEYRRYLMVGGMPEAVSIHANGAPLFEVRAKQQDISDAYLADMAKYAENADAVKIAACWRSVPSQLAKESGSTKFAWKMVAKGARSDRYSNALNWLISSGIVEQCTQVTDGESPLKTFENPSAFKVYMADVGLLSSAYDAVPQDLLGTGPRTARFRGGLAENYVMQQLVSAGVKAYYWGVDSKYEVEFVIRNADGVIPVEVKSGRNTQAVSVRRFAEKYGCPYVVKVTAKNFGDENGVRNVPLYAACLLGE